MDITFRPVTRENFSAVAELAVTPEQAEFVAPNLYSRAEAYVEPTWTPLAIYAGDQLVGFALFGRDDETGRWCASLRGDGRPLSLSRPWIGLA